MIECENCHCWFVPEQSRWLCPNCKTKNSCCEGEPQEERKEPRLDADFD